MSLETAQKVIVPQKKNYVPQFLKQRDINSYYSAPSQRCFFFKKGKQKMRSHQFMVKFARQSGR
jgi:hypothetical protein